ncbi:MAG: proline dehydrogenase family protein [Acidobacteria bacterium]|nr:proline dehydrogenase family protein [Acidobacteriota bacterium]
MDMLIKNIMLAMANNKRLTDYIAAKGMKLGFARRFVAGEELDDALKVVVDANRKGILASLDHLGENVSDAKEALKAAEYYHAMLDVIRTQNIQSSISVKLTQLGLDISEATCRKYIEGVVQMAASHGQVVEIDMEDSSYTERTISIFKGLHRQFDNLRLCIQAYLYRSEKDVNDLLAIGARIRLCKGAYNEPKEVAFPSKEDVDANYKKLARRLLEARCYPAIATHDEAMIEHIRRCLKELRVDQSEFEFQMLYGVRRDLQDGLRKEGFNLRVYIPYGAQWCPYFMRRLAERPANTWFVLKNLILER